MVSFPTAIFSLALSLLDHIRMSCLSAIHIGALRPLYRRPLLVRCHMAIYGMKRLL
jgi:hypothetical protein